MENRPIENRPSGVHVSQVLKQVEDMRKGENSSCYFCGKPGVIGTDLQIFMSMFVIGTLEQRTYPSACDECTKRTVESLQIKINKPS